MMKVFPYIIFYFLTNLALNAQTIIDSTDFFPMQIGNYWEYRANTLTGPKYFSVRIKGDTTLDNGKRYLLFYEKPFDSNDDIYWYFRKDSNKIYKYYPESMQCISKEYKYFDFAAELPDSAVWQICKNEPEGNARGLGRTLYDDRYFSWFGKPLETKIFHDVLISEVDTIWSPSDGSLQMAIAKSIGIVYQLRFGIGEFYLQGAIINNKKFGLLTEINKTILKTKSQLYIKAYPNPFNNQIVFSINIEKSGYTELYIYNILGQLAEILLREDKISGQFKITYNSSKLSNGIYFAILRQNDAIRSEKIVIIK